MQYVSIWVSAGVGRPQRQFDSGELQSGIILDEKRSGVVRSTGRRRGGKRKRKNKRRRKIQGEDRHADTRVFLCYKILELGTQAPRLEAESREERGALGA